MATKHGPLDLDPFGIKIEFLSNGERSGGESLEMEVTGRRRDSSPSDTCTLTSRSASRCS